MVRTKSMVIKTCLFKTTAAVLADQSCIRLYITVDTFVVVYKFAFDFTPFHCKVTVLILLYSSTMYSDWVSKIRSKSVFSILVSISV